MHKKVKARCKHVPVLIISNIEFYRVKTSIFGKSILSPLKLQQLSNFSRIRFDKFNRLKSFFSFSKRNSSDCNTLSSAEKSSPSKFWFHRLLTLHFLQLHRSYLRYLQDELNRSLIYLINLVHSNEKYERNRGSSDHLNQRQIR